MVFGVGAGALQTVLLSIIAGVLLLAALDVATHIAVPAVLALLCALALSTAVRRLERINARDTNLHQPLSNTDQIGFC